MGHGTEGLLILHLGGGGLEITIQKSREEKFFFEKEMSLRFFWKRLSPDVSCDTLIRRQSVAVNCNITNSKRRYGQFVKLL